MTDEERELPPEQEAAVRRLLAEARATEPMPADVAARLDRVLVGLGEEGFPDAAARHVVAPPWRRRRATVVLVAAAAVVAIGVGLGQLDGVGDGGDSDSGGAADSAVTAERAPSADLEDGDGDGDGDGAAPAPSEAGSAYATSPDPATPVGRVDADRFTADVNQLRLGIPEDAVDGEFVQLAADQLTSGSVITGRPFECAPAVWGAGVLVPVYVDGTPFVLAYRPATGESQIVDLLRCGTGQPERSTTLKAD